MGCDFETVLCNIYFFLDIISDALSRQKAKAKSSIPLTHDPVKDQRSKSPSEEADDPPNDYSSPLLHPQVSHHALQNGDLFSDCGIVPDYSERGDELKGCDGVEHDSFNDDVFEWPSPPSDQLIEDSEASSKTHFIFCVLIFNMYKACVV